MSGMDDSLRGTGGEFHTPNYWLIRLSKTRHLVRRETAFVHNDYKNHIQLTHRSMQAESNDFRASSTAVKQVVPTPRRNLKVTQ